MESSAARRLPGDDLADKALVPGTAILAATFLLISLWMVVDSRSFFEQIGPFGVYNPHYIGDAAAFQAGVGVALAASIRVRSLMPGALLAATAMAGLHAVNHWIDVDAANGGSNADVFDAVSLTLQFLLTLGLLRAAMRQAAP